MKLKPVGKNASEVEVTQIETKGIWVLSDDKEYFLPFARFPFFRNATVSSIHNVLVISPGKVRWPDLDFDLAWESLEKPEKVSLICK